MAVVVGTTDMPAGGKARAFIYAQRVLRKSPCGMIFRVGRRQPSSIDDAMQPIPSGGEGLHDTLSAGFDANEDSRRGEGGAEISSGLTTTQELAL